jgi:hypothetical protein
MLPGMRGELDTPHLLIGGYWHAEVLLVYYIHSYTDSIVLQFPASRNARLRLLCQVLVQVFQCMTT